ncbi:hypothetical protein D3C77_498640 [compost metagenome]
MDRHLAGHFTLAGQFTAEVLGGFEAPAGDQLAVEVGKAQFQQRERLGERCPVVDDCIDNQGAVEIRMAAYHQVAAFDPVDVDPGRHLAAHVRAQLLEPRAVLVLAGELVEVEPDVLAGQSGSGQQHQEDPQQALAPVGLGFLPVQLQRVVDQIEQRFLARRAAGGRAQAGLAALVVNFRGVKVVFRRFGRQVLDRRFIELGGERTNGLSGLIQVVIQRLQ